MRLGLIHIGQETNDFNPLPTTLRDYEAFGVFEGPRMIEELRGIGQVGGHLKAVEDSGRAIETVPIIRAHAVAGGRIDRAAFDHWLARIAAGLEAAGQLDGLALQLHGACAADGVDDVEGAQIEFCRRILGPDFPIVVGLDHHANVTRQIMANATAIVGHRTQPHNPFDTGYIGTALLIRVVAGEVKPVMAWRKLPMVTHQEQFLTDRPPMQTWFDQARGMEADPRVLHVGNYPMQPWLDVAEGGWSTIVVTDDDPALAERLADESADLAWSLRESFMHRIALPVDEAVRLADAAPQGVVVLSDTGDTVFGGAAGDSNLLLESMLRQNITGRALVPMISAAAAAKLHAAGPGATVTLPLGGDATPFFTPLTVTGTVRRISDGRVATPGMHQREVDMGRSVIFETGPVTLLITELRGVAGNTPDVYRALGVEPVDYKMAVVKTASNFQYFASIASQLIRVDTRGPGQSDVAGLPWKRLPRPCYPLDPVEDWRAQSTANNRRASHAKTV